jgi:hypothetical protein
MVGFHAWVGGLGKAKKTVYQGLKASDAIEWKVNKFIRHKCLKNV